MLLLPLVQLGWLIDLRLLIKQQLQMVPQAHFERVPTSDQRQRPGKVLNNQMRAAEHVLLIGLVSEVLQRDLPCCDERNCDGAADNRRDDLLDRGVDRVRDNLLQVDAVAQQLLLQARVDDDEVGQRFDRQGHDVVLRYLLLRQVRDRDRLHVVGGVELEVVEQVYDRVVGLHLQVHLLAVVALLDALERAQDGFNDRVVRVEHEGLFGLLENFADHGHRVVELDLVCLLLEIVVGVDEDVSDVEILREHRLVFRVGELPDPNPHRLKVARVDFYWVVNHFRG